MTPTTLLFRFPFPSEKDAYVRAVDIFLTICPALFTDPTSSHVCEGRDKAILFLPAPDDMHQPAPLQNGWYAETCLSNDQKVKILDMLAQHADLKRGTDWDWQAENTPSREFIDVNTLLAKL